MSWGTIAVAVNLVWIAVLYIIERFEASRGAIPPRAKEVAYIQDFWTVVIGDTVGFSMIDFVLVKTIAREGLQFWMVLAVILGLCGTRVWYRLATQSRRKEDCGIVKRDGKWILSWVGRFHIVYFFSQLSVGIIGIVYLLEGRIAGSLLAIGLGGLGLYALTYFFDWKKGVLRP